MHFHLFHSRSLNENETTFSNENYDTLSQRVYSFNSGGGPLAKHILGKFFTGGLFTDGAKISKHVLRTEPRTICDWLDEGKSADKNRLRDSTPGRAWLSDSLYLRVSLKTAVLRAPPHGQSKLINVKRSFARNDELARVISKVASAWRKI